MARRLHLLTFALAGIVACDNPNEPNRILDQAKHGPAKSAMAAVGAYEGTVYFTLVPENSVYKVDPNGGSPVRLATGTLVRVAPGGTRLAVYTDPTQTLATMDADGSNTHVLFTGFNFSAIAWSPDGSQVAAYYPGNPAKIRVFNATTGSFTDVAAPGTPLGSLDWGTSNWAVSYGGVKDPPVCCNNSYQMISTAPAGAGGWSDLFALTWFSVGSGGAWNPSGRAVRFDAQGNVFWAGSNFVTNQRGIFNASGGFSVNTGTTPDFAFSIRGSETAAMAAIRVVASSGTNSYFLDVIDWLSKGFVRTLYSSQFSVSGGNQINSVDWSKAATGTPPIASIAYVGTGTANEFTFSGTGSAATTAGATIHSYAWDFGDGTTATSATVTHAFQIAGEHVVTLKVTDTQGFDGSTSVTLSAKLSIATVVPSPSVLSVGDKFTIDVDVRNDGGVPITGVAPSVVITPSTIARIDSGPKPASFDLVAGTHLHFTFYATALSAGDASAVVDASGIGPSGKVSAQQRQRDLTISGAGLGVQLSASPDTPDVGSEITVTATLTNFGIVDLVNIVGLLTTTPSTGVNIVGSTPASITRLTPGAHADLTWKVTAANPGELVVNVLAVGKEDNTAALERRGSNTLTTTIVDRRLIVTTTGDETLDAQHLTAKICDVSVADGNQCTLRAAIQLANTLTGPQAITFNIAGVAGGGVPTITPATQLPSITVPLTLDATTQSGGWVELSGASAGDASGLTVDAGPTTIRGFVINRWKQAGIYLRGGTSNVVTGNRIGTTSTASAAAANGAGVHVSSGGARIGGTAGTGTTDCRGDCNVISGNSTVGLWIDAGSAITVSGNYIGTNATGSASVTNAQGIMVGKLLDGTGTGNVGVVLIGGTATASGVAPGNLISGNSVGLSVFAGDVRIKGNLIGPDRSGTRSLPPVSIGMYIGDGANELTQPGLHVTVGGAAAGDANVISGNEDGIHIFSTEQGNVLVEGNRIGTTPDGTAALPNSVGVIQEQSQKAPLIGTHAEVRDNVISGNAEVGVYNVALVAGNRIGTNAAGDRPIPNRVGVSQVALVGGLRPAGSNTCVSPCNLISGNLYAAVEVSKLVQGNFIGTDITGHFAVANSVAGNASSAVTGNEAVGGASRAVEGVCDRACNLITGNAAAAISTDYGGVFQGNVIGGTSDGAAIGNRGAAIVTTGGGVPGPLIGGDGDLGNAIVGNGGAAVHVNPTGPSTGPTITGNRITGNATGFEYPEGFVTPRPPVIASVIRSGIETRIHGNIVDLVTGNSFISRIDFYASPACEPGPQGAVPIGHMTIGPITDGTFDMVVTGLSASLSVITTTSTVGGVTSNFSPCSRIGGGAQGTQVSAAARAGDNKLEVTSNDGFSIGGWAKIHPGASNVVLAASRVSVVNRNAALLATDATNTEWKKIRGFGSLIFTSPLAFDHAVGEAVEPAGAPPAAGWLVSVSGDVTPFGGAPALTWATDGAQLITPNTSAAATATGRGLWALTSAGIVLTSGDAGLYGDARSQLGPSENAVALLPISARGYLIVTNRGRVLSYGDATTLGNASVSPPERIVSAVLMPSRKGYLMISACGAIFGFGDAANLSAPASGPCNVVGAAVPNAGVGLWVAHADGRVDALRGANSFAQTSGVPSAVGIAAEGDGYILVDATGRMYPFGTQAPTPATTRTPVVGVVAVPR